MVPTCAWDWIAIRHCCTLSTPQVLACAWWTTAADGVPSSSIASGGASGRIVLHAVEAFA